MTLGGIRMPSRSAGGDRPGGQRRRVAELAHRREGDPAHRGRGGERAAADRAERAAGDDRRARQPAGAMPDPCLAGRVEVFRETRPGDDVAHQEEQRNHGQGVLPGCVDQRMRRRDERGSPPVDRGEADDSDRDHGDRNRNPQEDEDEENQEARGSQLHRGATARARSGPPRRARGKPVGPRRKRPSNR